MSNIYINSATGDASHDGSRRKPFQTMAQAVAAGISYGDTVWIKGTLTEIVSVLSGVTYRNWGTARFVIDGGGVRTGALSVPSAGANKFTVIGAELTGVAGSGNAYNEAGPASGGRLFDCYAHDNNATGFNSNSTAKNDTRFYGCIAESNGNDGFSVHGTNEWVAYDCVAIDHDSGTATDGYTTHDDGIINCYRCVAIGCTKGWSLTHESGRMIIANCYSVDCEIGVQHAAVDAIAGSKPSTLVYGSLFILNGEVQNTTTRGVTCQQGASIDCLMTSVYNQGRGGSGGVCYSYGATDDSNSNGVPTQFRLIGCVSEITSSVEAIHVRAATLSNFLMSEHNLYRDQSGDRFYIGGTPKTKAEWLDEAGGLDSSSIFYGSAIMLGVPTNEATMDFGRLQPAAAAAAKIPNLKTFLEDEGLDYLWGELEILSQEQRELDAVIHNPSPRLYQLTDSCAFMGINGGPFDVKSDEWMPGCFSEGAKTTLSHVNFSENGGTFMASGHNNTGGIADRRINKVSIAGDRTKQVVVKRYLYQSQALTAPLVGNLTAGRGIAGKPVALMLANVPPVGFVEKVLPPGEDLYLSIAAQAATINVEISYEIRDVKVASGALPPVNSYRIADA